MAWLSGVASGVSNPAPALFDIGVVALNVLDLGVVLDIAAGYEKSNQAAGNLKVGCRKVLCSVTAGVTAHHLSQARPALPCYAPTAFCAATPGECCVPVVCRLV